MSQDIFYILIVGGGVNGAGIARDAAGRGLKVMLVEMDDLASKTSSASSKLIHGGLRYLEHYAFRLVREALGERETLLSIAPHIIWPMTFVLPHDSTIRPAWMIRAGLFLYDHLAGRVTLPGSRQLDFRRHEAGRALDSRITKGFSYADCWVDDARLVTLNALDARERGAQIHTRTRFVNARREGGHWSVSVERAQGARANVKARMLVNAAGPWVRDALNQGLGVNDGARLRMVKGSHIVVRKLYDGDHAYILQNNDKRIVFIIPYETDYTLIGTTDVPFEGDAGKVTISNEERAYLCAAANRSLARPVQVDDIVWDYSGVRPLYDDGGVAEASKVTRDYTLDLQAGEGQAPLLSIYGGKITTYRRLSEHALEKLAPWIAGARAAWTGSAALPGGDLPGGDFIAFLANVRQRYPFLPARTALRLSRAYGTRIERIMGGARSLADLGRDLGAGLSEREVDYLIAEEFALDPSDILWRRSKLGLHGGAALADALDSYMAKLELAATRIDAASTEAPKSAGWGQS